MEISDAYRKSRRNISIVCGISLAWAAAQFELKSLIIGAAGVVDISGASISILLVFTISYMLLRLTIEFVMQTKEVRRWKLAQFDYRITLNLVRISFLALAVTTFTRSIEAVVTTIIAAVFIILSYFIVVFILVAPIHYLLMPLIMRIRWRQGRRSGASIAIEAADWSILIGVIFYVGLLLYFGKATFEYLPFIGDLVSLADMNSIIVFVVVFSIVIFSWFFENTLLKKIFVFEPKYNFEMTPLEDGKIGVSWPENPNHPDYIAPKPTINDGES